MHIFQEVVKFDNEMITLNVFKYMKKFEHSQI